MGRKYRRLADRSLPLWAAALGLVTLGFATAAVIVAGLFHLARRAVSTPTGDPSTPTQHPPGRSI